MKDDTIWHAWNWGRVWHGYDLTVYTTLSLESVGWSVNRNGAHLEGGEAASLPLAFLAAERYAAEHECAASSPPAEKT